MKLRPRPSEAKPGRVLARAVGLSIALSLPGWATPSSPTPVPTEQEILSRLSRVADLYLSSALEFSCVEKIRWVDYGSTGRVANRGGVRSNYLFSTTDDEELAEIRAPRGIKSLEQAEGRMDKRNVRLYVSRAYFWTVLFHSSRWDMYEYEILPPEADDGPRTARIEFRPIPPIVENANDWFGFAVVDLDTFQLLRAEGNKAEDHEMLRRYQEMMHSEEELPVAVAERTAVVVAVSTEFGEEKNGLRLPSRVEVTKTRYIVRGTPGERRVRETAVRRVRQSYSDYRFFSVWSSEQIRDHVFARLPKTEAAIVARAGLPQPLAGEQPLPEDEPLEDRPLGPQTAYEEPFDWNADDPDAVREWRVMGWQMGLDQERVWAGSVDDGFYRLSNENHPSQIYTQTFELNRDISDAPIRVRVMLEELGRPSRTPAVGLLYRYNPGRTPRYYALVLTYRGELQFLVRKKSGPKVLYSVPVEGFELGRFYELQLAGRGDTFTLKLDGELLEVVRDSLLPEGAPGVYASGRGRFGFDDLALYFPEAANR